MNWPLRCTANKLRLSLALRSRFIQNEARLRPGFGEAGSTYLLRTERTVSTTHHQLRRRDHHDSAAARSSRRASQELQEILRDTTEVSEPGSRDGQQSLAHAVRRVHRHGRQHGRLHEDREDRYREEDAHRAGRSAAGRRRRGAAQEESAVHAEHRDRQHHARIGGVLPDEGQPRRRRARAGQLVRHRRSSG